MDKRGGWTRGGGVCACGSGVFFFCSEKGLLSLKLGWVPVRWCQIGGGCVCVDDPIDKWFKHEPHANTHSSFRPHMSPSAQRYVR